MIGTVCVREPASRRSLARGRVDRSPSSTPTSSEDIDVFEPAEDLRRRFVGLEDCAHSGTGCRASNCLRKRRAYSAPLTISSESLARSFRNREFSASDIANRSSSLSSQAGLVPFSPSSNMGCCVEVLGVATGGPESRKNSLGAVNVSSQRNRGDSLHPHHQHLPLPPPRPHPAQICSQQRARLPHPDPYLPPIAP